MPLLDPSDFPAIRAALDIDLAEDDVPDAIISLPIYQGQGEAEVLRRVPTAGALTGDELEAAKLGAVLFTAALVAEGLPRTTQERVGNWQYSQARASADVATIAAGLRKRAEAALVSILPDPPPARRRFAGAFTVARAAR